jgi:phage-related tail protein
MPKMNPILEAALRGAARVGAKALGAAADSLLEQLGSAADEVSTKATRGRQKLDSVGVGRPKAPRRSRRARSEEEDE